MGIVIENLKRGQFITIIKDRQWPDQEYDNMIVPPDYTGQPFEVLAISVPFICVSNGRKRFSIDSRRFEITLVNHQYAREMERSGPGPKLMLRRKRRNEGVELIANTSDRGCPQCGQRLIERLRNREWVLYCRNCGFYGEALGETA